ncbi:MAG TPA: (2Fe-2S)-binding protein [Chloroflexota bacterium]|nr:(2Fe-2S)-binding protein [Chloroflexota bacterium]
MEETERGVRTLETARVNVTVNGVPWSGDVPVEEVLLDFLRDRVGLTGTKRGCESEVCGACTVLVDGGVVSACNFLAFEVDGRSVTTVEGLARGGELHPLQKAFIRNVAAQCGYCTPGQLMAAAALLSANPSPTYDEIAHWLIGNICRCGCYPAIATSIQEAAAELRGATV